MNLFTPELYVRGQSDDEATQQEVDKLWEEANERYEQRLREIEPELPEHVRQFNHLLLHDARVFSIARRDDQLIFVMRKDIPPRDIAIITYFLTDEPYVDQAALPGKECSTVMEYLYDKFDLVHEGDTKLYTLAILFSNGWEMRLRFRDVRIALADPLYAASGPASASASASKSA